MACIPADWHRTHYRWSDVASETFGLALTKEATLLEKLLRLRAVARSVVAFIKREKATHVFIEGYSYGLPFGAHGLGELGGTIKLAVLEECEILPSVVPPASARRVLLGKIPKGKGKNAVALALARAGAAFGTADEGDAFAVANFGLTELGVTALCLQGYADGVIAPAPRAKSKGGR